MTYKLEFHQKALKEWHSLDEAVRAVLKKKLEQRLSNPKNPGARLSGKPNRYKIKLKKPGIRLVYEVIDQTVTVRVIAVGPRSRSAVYKLAAKR